MGEKTTAVEYFFARSEQEHRELTALLVGRASRVHGQMTAFINAIADASAKGSTDWLDSLEPKNIISALIDLQDQMRNAAAMRAAVQSLKRMIDFEKGADDGQ